MPNSWWAAGLAYTGIAVCLAFMPGILFLVAHPPWLTIGGLSCVAFGALSVGAGVWLELRHPKSRKRRSREVHNGRPC